MTDTRAALTFGHEPMKVQTFGGGTLVREFTTCARCYNTWGAWRRDVSWPCATARVLGIATEGADQ